MVTQEAYDDLQRKYSDLEAKYERMLPLMNYLQRHLFGQSSERHVQSPSNDLQGSLFAPDAPIETVIEEKEQITYERTKKATVKHPGRKPLNADLPREVIEVLHAEADPATMERIGEQVTEQLSMRPAQFFGKRPTNTMFVN